MFVLIDLMVLKAMKSLVSCSSKSVSVQGSLLHQQVELPCLGVLYLEIIPSTSLQKRYSPTDLSPAGATFLFADKEFRVCAFSPFHPSILLSPTHPLPLQGSAHILSPAWVMVALTGLRMAKF